MQTFKAFRALGILLLAGTSLLANAQDKASIQQKLTLQYALTKTTADKTDIVTAGAILVLKKDNLLTVDATKTNPFQNTYKDGKITQNGLAKVSRFQGLHLPGVASAPSVPNSNVAQRTFVAGEKLWVTKIEVTDTGVNMELFSDAFNDVRYGAVISLPFKGSSNLEAQSEKLVAELFDVQPNGDSGDNGQQQQQAPAAAPPAQQVADAPPPPIPPPPPPADAPPAAPTEIKLGQTKDMVVANLGQPQKIAKVGTKEIYTYKDLKITFVNGKVTDVQ